MNVSFTPLERFVDSEGKPDPKRMKRHEELRKLKPNIECYFLMCDLEELRNGGPTRSSTLCWNGKDVDLAELFGILFESGRMVVAGSKDPENREEFFRAIAQVFVGKKGKRLDGHSLSESFRRLSCSTYGRDTHFPGLQKDLLNPTKSKR